MMLLVTYSNSHHVFVFFLLLLRFKHFSNCPIRFELEDSLKIVAGIPPKLCGLFTKLHYLIFTYTAARFSKVTPE
jgi:hypothetical protein